MSNSFGGLPPPGDVLKDAMDVWDKRALPPGYVQGSIEAARLGAIAQMMSEAQQQGIRVPVNITKVENGYIIESRGRQWVVTRLEDIAERIVSIVGAAELDSGKQ
jgi:hypothetical protein